MTRTPPPTDDNGLFPASWITGVAAAELARHDKDVLIDDAVRAAPPASPGPEPTLRRRGRPSEAELAELRREMQRLERQMEQMRSRARYLDRPAADPEGALWPAQGLAEIPVMPPGEPPAGAPERAARGRRIGRIPALLIGALAVLALLLMALSLEFDGHPLGQRMQQVGQGLALRVERIGATLWNAPGGEQDTQGE